MTAGDYDAAATLVAAAPEGVDLIIADYRLPRVPNGARAAGRLRVLCRRSVPVLIVTARSEEHTSELQSLMRISYAVFCLKKKTETHKYHSNLCIEERKTHYIKTH